MSNKNSLVEAAEKAVGTAKSTQVTTYSNDEGYFQSKLKMAQMIATSALIPTVYRGKIADVMIAMELAEQMGMSLFTVTQNLDIIHGKAGWKSTFIIATINSSTRFASNLKFEWQGKLGTANWGCRAYVEEQDNTILYGTWITIEMATKEGWIDKKGSKWVTMPEQMLQYRAAAFFGRIYVPDLLMGLQSIDEVLDVAPVSKELIEKANSIPTTSVDVAVKKKEKEIKETKSNENAQKVEIVNNIEQDVAVTSLQELKEHLNMLGFKIMQIKENTKNEKWAKIIADDDEADFEHVMTIIGIKKIKPNDNYFVMNITSLK